MVKSILLKVDEDKFEQLSKLKGDITWEKFLLDNPNKDWDSLHVNIHAARLIPNYKPTQLEMALGAIIVERFKNSCDECRKVSERNKNLSADSKRKSFWDKLINT